MASDHHVARPTFLSVSEPIIFCSSRLRAGGLLNTDCPDRGALDQAASCGSGPAGPCGPGAGVRQSAVCRRSGAGDLVQQKEPVKIGIPQYPVFTPHSPLRGAATAWGSAARLVPVISGRYRSVLNRCWRHDGCPPSSVRQIGLFSTPHRLRKGRDPECRRGEVPRPPSPAV